MPKGTSKETYRVACGDASLYFAFGRKYKHRYLVNVFRKRLVALNQEFFPGLVFEGANGNHFRPELQVEFVPVELEETS